MAENKNYEAIQDVMFRCKQELGVYPKWGEQETWTITNIDIGLYATGDTINKLHELIDKMVSQSTLSHYYMKN